jgi:hypothetical protein
MHFQTHITSQDVQNFQHFGDFQANFSMTFLKAFQAFLSTTFIFYEYLLEYRNFQLIHSS